MAVWAAAFVFIIAVIITVWEISTPLALATYFVFLACRSSIRWSRSAGSGGRPRLLFGLVVVAYAMLALYPGIEHAFHRKHENRVSAFQQRLQVFAERPKRNGLLQCSAGHR
ncbi:hypothetical protein [Bradyrhizobium sp. CCGUVB23]|uniref:hypothetical protein n=1 Tax=Bradyrhizobium sp. CCGUVB23 TaxID=2949630 RepID=UPI0020B45EED|nr:hypothetical protein [Bradyrhizobium sp. CCGUVB23]MCP3459353.1 hypothetical protein [Bradyrhizobium sp. CCGUVB23]